MNIHLIAAYDEQRTMGVNGKLPWHLPDDLKRFKQLTLGQPVIMGRKTFESIGKPLPNRTNIVLSKTMSQQDGCIICHSLQKALSISKEICQDVFIIGGANVFAESLPLAHFFHLTLVHTVIAGDVLFPTWDKKAWQPQEEIHHPADEHHAFAMTFLTYQRLLPST